MGKPPETVHDRTTADLPLNSVTVPDIVADPLDVGKLKVLRSIRDDPLAGMHARGQIDDAQMAAGRLWQQYQEDCEIGGVRAIDPTREAVDGGRFKEPDLTRMSVALAKLKQAKAELEEYGVSLIQDVLERRMTITQIAAARSITSGRQICYIMERFRAELEKLAKLWGFAQ